MDRQKTCVSLACQTFARRGWAFHYDAECGVWDVETPNGWRTASTGFELWAIAKG